MIMQLQVPADDPSLRAGRVTRWYKGPGDDFEFGEVVCEVAVDEFAVLRRTARATLLSGRRRRKLRGGLETREGKVYVELALTSADRGVLRHILVEEGAPFAVGATLAVVSTVDHGDDGSISGWEGAPAMRIVANMLNQDDHVHEGE